MKLSIIRPIFILFAVTLMAAPPDASGKWTAQTPTATGTATTTFTFKVESGKLSGTITSPGEKLEFTGGEIKGEYILFSVPVDFRGERTKRVYDGKIKGDEIDFIVKHLNFDRSDQYIAKRVKSDTTD